MNQLASTRQRAVVIGAGVGGLCAALTLAAAGVEVVVLELSAEPGGKAGTTHRDGVSFDTGPSLLTLPAAFDAVLQPYRIALRDLVELIDFDAGFEYSWPDGTRLKLGSGHEHVAAQTRAQLGNAAGDELYRFLAYAEQIWEAAAPAFVWGPAPSASRVLSLGLGGLHALTRIDAMRSMRAAIESRVSNRYVRDVLLRYATYNGSDPRCAPATLNCIAWVELGIGGFGVRGGMHHLMRSLAELAVRAGVEFRYNTRVTAIEVSAGSVTGVKAGNERIPADLVVSNADVDHLFGDLLPAQTAPAAERQPPSTSGMNFVVRTGRKPTRSPHRVLFNDRYLAEFEDLFDAHRVPRDPTVYVCAGERAHARAGWGEQEGLFVMVNAPSLKVQSPTVLEDAAAVEATVLGRLRDAGEIDADAEVVWRRTPSMLAERFPGSWGAIYGMSSNSRFAAFRRCPNAIDQVRGLYVASGSAHPGGGVPMAALSGRTAALQALSAAGMELRR